MSADKPRRDVPGHNYRSLSDYRFPYSRVVGSNTNETQKEVKAEKTKAAPSSARKKLRFRDKPGPFIQLGGK